MSPAGSGGSTGPEPHPDGAVFGPAGAVEPRPPGGDGSTVLRPEDAERFTLRLDDLERSVAEARAALRGLADDPLPVGSGQDNAAIGDWYRSLLTGAAAPAADELARELDAVRRAVRDSVTAWEDTDRDAATSFEDPPPS